MENKKKSSAKDRLNAKRAKKIGKQQREYIPPRRPNHRLTLSHRIHQIPPNSPNNTVSRGNDLREPVLLTLT
jgi:hypothetical protein